MPGSVGETVKGRQSAAAFLAALFLASSPAAVSGSEDSLSLDLQNPMDSLFVSIDTDDSIDNPHEMECGNCHIPGQRGRQDGPLLYGEDTIRLCLECHPGSNLHPVGIPVPRDVDPKTLEIPLGRGEREGMITCLTCHYVHRGTYGRHILRSVDERKEGRMDTLCSACHRESLKSKSPHDSTGDACHLCHMNSPRKDEALQSINPNVQATCNFCHSAVENQHYLDVNPFSDEYILQETMTASIPLVNGRFTCISCHNPHDVEGRQKLLRESYLRLAAISKKINPHWKDVMCIACHDGEPKRGSAVLKEGGDLIRLCYRCHAFKYSRNEIHPVNVQPSRYVTVPPDMPLKDGRITCETCHDSSLQEGGERAVQVRRKNPKFLRGGFTTRNEFCYRCHSGDTIRVMNAHDQLYEDGSRRGAMCAFCHSSLPEGAVGWLERIQFDDDEVNDLCLLCHPSAYGTNHPRADHLVSPSRDVMRAMEESEERLGVILPLYGDKIVCVTCHNPHETGVISETAAAMGAGGENRLRMGSVVNICRVCHLSR